MTNENLNEIKKKLFGNLADKVIILSANQETTIFRRKMEFGNSNVYVEYNMKHKRIDRIYTNGEKKKILYNGKISEV